MGASNVARVFTYWSSDLGNRDALALVFMANIAKDTDTPSVYWGGWRDLAAAVGADCEAKPESAKRTAMKILKALSSQGVIVSSGNARQGVRAEYALALDPKVTYRPTGDGRSVKWAPVDRADPRVNKTDTLQGEQNGHPPLPKTFTQPVNKTFTPRIDRGTTEENYEESTSLGDQVKWEKSTSPEDDDQKFTLEDERNRQAAALQKLIAQQAKDTDAA